MTLRDSTVRVASTEQLRGGKFDLHDTPDLLPVLSILALKSPSPIEIVNVKHARFKETDRIAVLARELAKLGLNVQEREDGLSLQASGKLRGADLDAHDDHRLFMAFAIAGCLVGNCSVSDPQSVDVSYPDFIDEMNQVGARILPPLSSVG